MKKIMSLLLVLSLLLSMTCMVSAVDAQVLTDGTNMIELPWDTREASVYTYTATQTGTLYIVATDFYYAMGDYDYEDNTDNWDEWNTYTEFTVNGVALEGGYYGSVDVVEGQEYTFAWNHSADVRDFSWYDMGFQAELDLRYTDELVPKVGTEDMPVELYASQCPTDSIAIAGGEMAYYVLLGFQDMTLEVYGEHAYVMMNTASLDDEEEGPAVYMAENGVVSVTIRGGYVRICIGNAGQDTAVFRLECKEPMGTYSNPEPLKMGEQTITCVSDDFAGYYFTFTATCNGALLLTMPEGGWLCMAWSTGGLDIFCTYADVGVTNPIVMEVKKGDVVTINVDTFDAVTFRDPSGDLVIKAMEYYDHHYEDGVCVDCGAKESGEEVPELGSEERPIELYPENCPTETIEIPAGGSVWYVLYEFNYADFRVIGENAYVNATVYNMDIGEQEAYHLLPVDGVVTLPVITWRVWIEIGNSGTEPAVFQLDYHYPEGSKKNPAELNMGENTADVKNGNDDGPIYEGYIFEWVAQCNGQLTLTMPESDWTLIVDHLTSADEDDWYDDSMGENTIILDVKKGEKFRLYVLNHDEETETYREAEVKFTASVAYDHDYVDGACRHCGEVGATKLIGDVNGDGRINARDARALLRFIAGLEDGQLDERVADFNEDGRVNARDARAMLRFIAGLD